MRFAAAYDRSIVEVLKPGLSAGATEWSNVAYCVRGALPGIRGEYSLADGISGLRDFGTSLCHSKSPSPQTPTAAWVERERKRS
jgi:hypothetical protein